MSLFPGFNSERIDCGKVTLFVRHNNATDRPALLLLHGYPQTGAMWHQVAAMLTDRYHVIIPDLRGYGRSDKPDSQEGHHTYSKRSMALDVKTLLDHFGHPQAFVCAHDRGARVAHRMALDHESSVRALVLLDIAPTREMYSNTTDEFARLYWHWFFLIQPSPLPEMLINSNPREYWLRKCMRQYGEASPFHPQALEEYLECFEHPDAVHASCEDYRAAATIDIVHDNEDQGRKIKAPLLCLWAKSGAIEKCFDPLSLWATRAEEVTGQALAASHYMAEEIPAEIVKLAEDFYSQCR